jgi:ceramide glucosyltransferase
MQNSSLVPHKSSYYFHARIDKYAGDETVGVNPKVNNLVRPYHQASNDIVWIIDSNVSIAPGALARSVDALEGRIPPSVSSSKKRIGLVHHVPFAFYTEARVGSRLEEAFLNTNHAKMYLAINTVAIESCVVGKSNMYRRSDVERVNGSLKPIPNSQDCQLGRCGLAAFGQFLAEDNMIASALWHELDLRHELSCDVARNAVGNMSLSDYIWRRVRWIRVRKHMVLTATIVEPFTECMALAFIATACLRYLFGLSPWIFMVLHLPLWYLVDLDVCASLAGHPLPADRRWSFALHWAARELLALPIFLLAICGNEVEWRGRKYQVIKNGAVKVADRNSSIQIHHDEHGLMERA